MNKTKMFAILFSAIILFSLIALYFMPQISGDGRVAVIRQDGEILYEIDLDAVEEAYDIIIENEHGVNTIQVTSEGIGMKDADCPDRLCINQGSIEGPGIPIVCLPNRVTIEIEGEI